MSESVLGIDTKGMMQSEIQTADYLYCVCDAEFGSRQDVHSSYATAKGEKSWARYFLLHEVQKVAQREGLFCSHHTALKVAQRIAEDWFECKKEDEKHRRECA